MAFVLSAMMCHDGAYASDEAKKVEVQFLHDTHSHLNTFATVENGESQMMGGFARIKTLINEQKDENGKCIITRPECLDTMRPLTLFS